MARFLKLTNGYKLAKGQFVYVNIDLVAGITKSNYPDYQGLTCLGGPDDSVIAIVVETPEQIIEMLLQGRGI